MTRLNPGISNLLKDNLNKSCFIDLVFDHLVLEREYQSALKDFLRHELTYRHQILVHVALAFFELYYLNEEGMYRHLEILRDIPHEHFAEFSLNPLVLIENLYYCCRVKELKEDALDEILSFSCYPEKKP